MRTFRLYPVDRRWWSFADHGQLIDLMERFAPKRVLEFGPGGSTLALVEGGAEFIDTCEDDPHWYAIHRDALAPHEPVRLRLYTHADPLVIPATDGRLYDFAFVDGPKVTEFRPVEIAYAAARSRVVACHDATSWPVRDALEELRRAGWSVEIIPFIRRDDDANAMGVAVAP